MNTSFPKNIFDLHVNEVEKANQKTPFFIVKEHGEIIATFYYRKKLDIYNSLSYFFMDEKNQLQGNALGIYGNGKVAYQSYFVDDKLHGKYVSFYPNGMKHIVANYQNGKLHNTFYEYSNTGQLLYEENYKENILDGKMTIWSYDGKGRKELFFKEHRLELRKEYIHNLLVSCRNIDIHESDEYYKRSKENQKRVQEIVPSMMASYSMVPNSTMGQYSMVPNSTMEQYSIKRKYVKSGYYKKVKNVKVKKCKKSKLHKISLCKEKGVRIG